MKKIAIFGGGVGGCTVAHQLSKISKFYDDNNLATQSYDITIYEKKSEIGGLARSSRDQDLCATEYCWRVYFAFYDNLLPILKEISIVGDESKTVIDNLTKCAHVNVADKEFSWHDKIAAIYSVMNGMTMCDERLDQLDNISWWDSLSNTSDSHLFRAIGPWLGADRYKCSYKSVIKVGFEMDMWPGVFNKKVYNYITTKPTSEAWFDNWTYHLQQNGVNIQFNTALNSINIQDDQVISAEIIDKYGNKNIIEADYYVFSIPVEALTLIVEKTPELQKLPQFNNIPKLKDKALHMQLSFLLYFDRSISLGKNYDLIENNSFLLVDSPWDIIVLQYDKIYEGVKLCYKIPGAKGGWSVAVCTAYIPGIVYGKPFNRCTYEESVVELWEQMYTSKKLQELIMKNNGYNLEKNMVIKWSPMWPTYSFNEKLGALQTEEPKFTNNAGTAMLRPSYKTNIPNLFIATAYIKETIDIFSMEAACIGGKCVANGIDKRSPSPTIVGRPPIFAPFRVVDTLSYKLGLPNLGPLLLIIVCIFIIIIIVYIVKKLL